MCRCWSWRFSNMVHQRKGSSLQFWCSHEDMMCSFRRYCYVETCFRACNASTLVFEWGKLNDAKLRSLPGLPYSWNTPIGIHSAFNIWFFRFVYKLIMYLFRFWAVTKSLKFWQKHQASLLRTQNNPRKYRRIDISAFWTEVGRFLNQ